MGGIGGQPANFIDGIPVRGTGEYYCRDPNIVGLVSLEDMLVMVDEMGIDTGIDIERVLALGVKWEKTIRRERQSMRKEIVAPMPGAIVKVLVNVGDTVREGEDVVILESMKMENQISTQVSGNVKDILVAADDRVAAQQTLIILA